MYARRILQLLVVLLDSAIRVGHVGDDESALLVAIHHRVNRLVRARQEMAARELKQAFLRSFKCTSPGNYCMSRCRTL